MSFIEGLLKCDGFDDAIVGVLGYDEESRLVYSADKVIDILMQDDMTYEEALDYFNFNLEGAYMGKRTPLFIWEYDPDTVYF